MSKHLLTQEDRLAGNKARWVNYQKITAHCQLCGKKFSRPPSVFKIGKGKFCSQKCANGEPTASIAQTEKQLLEIIK